MKRLCSQIVNYAEDEVLVEGDDDLSDAYNPEEDDSGEETDDDDIVLLRHRLSPDCKHR